MGKPRMRSGEQGTKSYRAQRARAQVSMSVGHSPKVYISEGMSCSVVCEQVSCSDEKEVNKISWRGGNSPELRCSHSQVWPWADVNLFVWNILIVFLKIRVYHLRFQKLTVHENTKRNTLLVISTSTDRQSCLLILLLDHWNNGPCDMQIFPGISCSVKEKSPSRGVLISRKEIVHSSNSFLDHLTG
jgi:hypothetical protein